LKGPSWRTRGHPTVEGQATEASVAL